ncbi:hypothetical protein CISG_08711 [Coccidioides immitis RMSCC 3703]|uniref:Uncharacterized protein n=1 Tax=Coccidioides immitis RMSCC 3703 TaxID=454286 RepID=A0A0J8RA47_COCIT|nr:hypothetical protein CISG_08711 [Coccidioides immitis RMSCC 3703]
MATNRSVDPLPGSLHDEFLLSGLLSRLHNDGNLRYPIPRHRQPHPRQLHSLVWRKGKHILVLSRLQAKSQHATSAQPVHRKWRGYGHSGQRAGRAGGNSDRTRTGWPSTNTSNCDSHSQRWGLRDEVG